jgi:sulfate adenylyltransferase
MTGPGYTVWLTGLSGAGKSTIAQGLRSALAGRGRHVEVLDGDEVRQHLSKGLGFNREDRETNIRRVAYVAKLVTRSGGVAIAALISPYAAARAAARAEIGRLVEVYVSCPLEELVRRDAKGLYARALRGELAQFTGVSDPYEEPAAPEVTVHTDRETPAESVAHILDYLERAGYLAPPALKPQPAPIAPHGGRLVDRVATGAEAAELRARVAGMPRLALGPRALSDLELIATGAFSPVEGFLGRRDYDAVVEGMRLSDGQVWPLPITLAAAPHLVDTLAAGGEVALTDAGGRVRGVLALREAYERDIEREAELVYRTRDPAHPGVAAIRAEGPALLAGPVTLLERDPGPPAERPLRLTPAETRQAFVEREWRTVVGFQTRNPVHRAHEYVQKCALELVDGLLVHPLVGATKDDDLPAELRLRCYRALLDRYYPADRVLLATLPAAMRYAGPREAVFHALVRKNYGCTHFVVGRDHAGVGSYYGAHDAQALFGAFGAEELGIRPLFFERAFYCRACGGMATAKTCPHPEPSHVSLSGSELRALLASGRRPPPEFTRPEVADVLAQAAPVPPD